MRIGIGALGLCMLMLAGGCGDDAPPVAVDGGQCAAGEMRCDGLCIDTQASFDNCGACGTMCRMGEVCSMGACATSCEMGQTACGGACVDTASSVVHCGGCDMACAAGQACNAGVCELFCSGGTTACGGSCVDTQSSVQHCGGCDMACGMGQVCNMGMCDTVCGGGLTNCGGSCVDVNSSAAHCGGCDMACAADEMCAMGMCMTASTADADGDTISDVAEGREAGTDTDMDGTPDFMDADSDDDGISDAMEAGDADVTTAPRDSDSDGTPDFRDTDSDNDGLTDAQELALGTMPTVVDSDGDGDSDAVEVAAGTDPLDAMSTVGGGGGFTFDLIPGGSSSTDTLTFEPRIRRADVLFLVDTTGSMSGEITGIRTGLTALVGRVRGVVADTNFGASSFDDFSVSPYGNPTRDNPFELRQRITSEMMAITAGIDALALHSGADGPESQVEAFYQAATGAGFGTMVDAFDARMGFDAALGHGTLGGAGFRMGTQPIIVMATDQTFHRSEGDNVRTADRATWCGSAMSTSCDEYNNSTVSTAAGGGMGTTPHTVAEALTALNGISAKVLGIAASNNANARAELSAFAVRTGAYKSPVGGMCDTGVAGAMIAAESWDTDADPATPNEDICPLVYGDNDGRSIATQVGDAILDLVNFASFRTLHVVALDNPDTAAVDESLFFVRGVPSGYDPATCTAGGAVAPTSVDRLDAAGAVGADGRLDSFTGAIPGCRVSFQIVAQNPATGGVARTCGDQTFALQIVVIGNDSVEADTRTAVVRVPGDATLCP